MTTIHKLALLAHQVPGVSLIVYQPNWPPLLVALEPRASRQGEVWVHVDPSRFRRELVCPIREARRVIGPFLGDDDTEVRVDLVADRSTSFDEVGLFTTMGSGARSTVGFPTSASVLVPGAIVSSHPSLVTDDTESSRGAPNLIATVDSGLGTQLITCSYPADDLVKAAEARVIAFEALVTASVDELTLLTAA
ncbi:MAG: hypothetical protein AAF962_24285 [Actinomycetota bacterium]